MFNFSFISGFMSAAVLAAVVYVIVVVVRSAKRAFNNAVERAISERAISVEVEKPQPNAKPGRDTNTKNAAPVVSETKETKKEKPRQKDDKAPRATESEKATEGKYEGLDTPVKPIKTDFATEAEYKAAYSAWNNKVYRIRKKFTKALEDGYGRDEANVIANDTKAAANAQDTKPQPNEDKDSKPQPNEDKDSKPQPNEDKDSKPEDNTADLVKASESRESVVNAIIEKVKGKESVSISGVSFQNKCDRKVTSVYTALDTDGIMRVLLQTESDQGPKVFSSKTNFVSTDTLKAVLECVNKCDTEKKIEGKPNKEDIATDICKIMPRAKYTLLYPANVKLSDKVYTIYEVRRIAGVLNDVEMIVNVGGKDKPFTITNNSAATAVGATAVLKAVQDSIAAERSAKGKGKGKKTA